MMGKLSGKYTLQRNQTKKTLGLGHCRQYAGFVVNYGISETIVLDVP